MRQYYLCSPDGQAITGPHPLAELIRRAQEREITAEWFVAEPGSEQFITFSESFSLNEILFKGGAVPVDPPPVSGAKLKNAQPKPAPVEQTAGPLPDHHAEFQKVVEKSIRLQREPLPPAGSAPRPSTAHEQLSSDNVIHAAREDFQRVLQKHDELHFNPPTYWQSPAGERMKNFLQAEVFLLLSGAGFLGLFAMFNLLTNFFLIALPIGLGILTATFAYVFLVMHS